MEDHGGACMLKARVRAIPKPAAPMLRSRLIAHWLGVPPSTSRRPWRQVAVEAGRGRRDAEALSA